MPTAAPIPNGLPERYLSFADNEAQGRSPLYESLARGAAHDPDIIAFLSTLPSAKQQPNLLFAAVRSLQSTPNDSPISSAACSPTARPSAL